MTVRELMDHLKDMPPEARVLFDTEATEWQVHCVPVDGCEHWGDCLDAVVLCTYLPHGGGQRPKPQAVSGG